MTTPLPSTRPDFWPWVLAEAAKAHDRNTRNWLLADLLERELLDDVIEGDCCVSDTSEAFRVHMLTVHRGTAAATRRLVKRWEAS
jgi:hypothetical protein